MNTTKLVTILFLLIILISCKTENYEKIVKDGITIYKNKNTPQNKEFTLVTKELFTINGAAEITNNDSPDIYFHMASDLDFDSDNNIYIHDMRYNKLVKFAKNGNYVSKFGGSGTGPKEFGRSVYVTIQNDSIYIGDYTTRRIKVFDTNFNYLKTIDLENNAIAHYLTAVGKNRFLAMNKHSDYNHEDWPNYFKLEFMNYDLSRNKILKEYTFNRDKESHLYESKYVYYDVFLPFTTGAGKIVIGEVSDDLYKFNVYDLDCNLKYTVSKNCLKVPYSTEELRERFEKSIYNQGKKIFYKRQVPFGGLHIDKSGYVYVKSIMRRNEKNLYDLYFDVFKDGIFINKIKLDIAKGYDYLSHHLLTFHDNKIYYINQEENYVKAFTYSYQGI